MNDTPRTNAAAGYPDGSGCWKYNDLGLYVDADFARELERENTRLRKLAVRLYNSGYHAGHHDTVEAGYVDIFDCDMDTYHAETVEEIVLANYQGELPARTATPHPPSGDTRAG